MRLSQYFLPVLREVPSEAEIASHKLMLRAGMIRQASAGIYTWLPLGFQVLKKVEQIVREEQNRAGAIELLMPTLQQADLWRESGRYDAYGPEMLRFKDRHEREMLYGPTNEELITQVFRGGAKSYRDLPRLLYHIQWKFRDEMRPRFGVMRGREFLMKDAYSFDLSVEAARHSYNRMFVAYLRTFARMGLKSIPMVAETGPIGGDLSHEFIILAETGESQVFCHADLIETPVPPADVDFGSDLTRYIAPWTRHYAATDDKHDEKRFAAEVPQGQAGVRARGRDRPHFLLRHQVLRAHGVPRAGAGREHGDGADGVVRRRCVAPARGHHRGQPRRGRHRLAGAGGAVRGRPRQPQGGRQGHRCGVRGPLWPAAGGRAFRCSTTTRRSGRAASSPPWI